MKRTHRIAATVAVAAGLAGGAGAAVAAVAAPAQHRPTALPVVRPDAALTDRDLRDASQVAADLQGKVDSATKAVQLAQQQQLAREQRAREAAQEAARAGVAQPQRSVPLARAAPVAGQSKSPARPSGPVVGVKPPTQTTTGASGAPSGTGGDDGPGSDEHDSGSGLGGPDD